MRLSSFFKTPSSWSKSLDVIDYDGNSLDLNNWPTDVAGSFAPRIKAMSLNGAVAYFFSQEREPEKRSQMVRKLSKAIETVTKKRMYIAEFGKDQSTTFEDLRKVLSLAEKM